MLFFKERLKEATTKFFFPTGQALTPAPPLLVAGPQKKQLFCGR